ncbi:MAG: TIGR02587 family membrane protein, partial [Deltaproteobacteria bacterium]|nr:TIGR02587 family membrane protein [Deltaproteobacteria bacterium]
MSPWRNELDDLGRALSGAFLFGAPLVFTMEMWQIGSYMDAWRLLAALLLAVGGNAHLAHFAGFKKGSGLRSSLAEAVEALGVGVVASAAFLLMLNRVSFADRASVAFSTILIEAIPLSIGASIANAVFRKDRDREGDDASSRSARHDLWRDVGATLVGATFVSSSIAPTEEVPLLALELTPWHRAGLVAFSLVVSWIIVFESGFFGSVHPKKHVGRFQRPLPETVLAYAVSLSMAAVS